MYGTPYGMTTFGSYAGNGKGIHFSLSTGAAAGAEVSAEQQLENARRWNYGLAAVAALALVGFAMSANSKRRR